MRTTPTIKYGIRDYRGGGRSSARETAMRVAAGGIAKKYLKQEFGVEIRAYLSQMGDVSIDKVDWNEIDNNAFFCPDVDKVDAFDQLIRDLKKKVIRLVPRFRLWQPMCLWVSVSQCLIVWMPISLTH